MDKITNSKRWTSLPVRGAWVEIKNIALIYVCRCRRSPCGERGLKCDVGYTINNDSASLPVRGAWVEISSFKTLNIRKLSLPVRGAWVEICSESA